MRASATNTIRLVLIFWLANVESIDVFHLMICCLDEGDGQWFYSGYGHGLILETL
jgi:hypothetical protein